MHLRQHQEHLGTALQNHCANGLGMCALSRIKKSRVCVCNITIIIITIMISIIIIIIIIIIITRPTLG